MRDVPIYPVIMCGGSGSRLWPSSRPANPKQFLPLVGERSLLQDTVLRVHELAADGGSLLIVAGAAHGRIIRSQLAAIGVEAAVIVEPEPRDSAAAIAVAAAWIAERDPDAVAVIVASDHHVPDHAAFRAAVRLTVAAAADGAIVTLGVRPTEPATAYGYIRAGEGEGVAPVAAFVEKPDAARAAAYVAQGFLWNSGNFVATAATLLAELEDHAGAVTASVVEGLRTASDTEGVTRLGEAFLTAPKISFDYAVMEKTRRAAVLPVAFAWSDLGAWDAVWAASAKDANGNVLAAGASAVDASDVLVRAPAGVRVSVIGSRRLAVVVEPDAVLVCDFDHAQAVKSVAEAAHPGAPEAWTLATLPDAAAWYRNWLETAALPVWATLGADAGNGGFREALAMSGAAVDPHRRLRTQTRQVMVYAMSAAKARPGPWMSVATRGFAWMQAHGRRPDGLYVNRLTPEGRVLDETAQLYEQAFALMALSALKRAGAQDVDTTTQARALRTGLDVFRHPAGGFREAGPHPFQANAHMHLFEAALDWEGLDSDDGWRALADQIAELALGRFIGADDGLLQEFFDADWAPYTGEAGLVEPGHHFEWAWLLARWGAARGDRRGHEAASRLYARGLGGVDVRRGVALNSVWPDFSPRDATARLWPQTEFLKAALVLGDPREALMAANALRRYLETPVRGVWRDRMRADGGFVEEPAPATSLYHLYLAIAELERVAG